MTVNEWRRLVVRMNIQWPYHPVEEKTRNEWFKYVHDLPTEQVAVALEAYVLDGERFPPHGGMLRKKVAELATDDGATWAQVWAEIGRAVSLHGFYRDPDEWPWSSPLVAELVRLVGWQRLCSSTDSETTLEAQCREKWLALKRQALEDRSFAGMQGAGLKRLEARRGGMTAVGDVLRPKLLPGGREDAS